MKYLIIVFFSISLACAHEIRLREGIKPQKFPPIKLDADFLSKAQWETLRSITLKKNETIGAGSVQADVTEYVLTVLTNIADLIVHAGLDPMELSDEHITFTPGTFDLTNGWLQDLSSITVFDKVIAKYTLSTHILELTLPIGFGALLIDYDYHLQVVILSITGTIDGKISNLKLDLHMGFNFSEYHAFVDNVDVRDTGSIELNFTGLGILDWILDLMTGAIINLFHNLILSLVNLLIYDPVQSVVSTINGIIDGILHPNATDLMMMT